ncbi:MAG: DUF475 domain-containing protein [Candidatus Levybacteria bacterium]|nr:DUF475 domain-containing protein [Candidatus Levybacteria bacterium]
MELLFVIMTILGLCVFEVITSIDNAVINAEVLSGMSKKARRWFLTYGFFFAVFVVRGLLPFLIIWAATPSLGPIEVLGVSISGSEAAKEAIEHTAPLLLLGGGVFLIFLFFNWLFLEPKNFGLRGEKFFQGQGAWFFAIVSVLLAVIVYLALKVDDMLAFSAVIGSTAFFIIHGFRQFAEQQEAKLLDKKNKMSDVSKIAYLEVLDTTFSIDGVVGAFAFTFSVPFILIGNGIGALILRKLTISNIDRIKQYKFLKNGAMYSIFFLGAIMSLHAFHIEVPPYVSPIITFGTVGYFFWKSKTDLKKMGTDISAAVSSKK